MGVNQLQQSSAPWVIVAGGFHQDGGMDKANFALANYLVERGNPLHLVCYQVSPELAKNPLVQVHQAKKPVGSFLIGNWNLGRLGQRVATQMIADRPDTRVVVNGGNCPWGDINWVHYVHRAWRSSLEGTPIWFRAKDVLDRWWNSR